MFKTPDLMRTAQDLARHSGARQSLIAKNIANTDTPGFRARDMVSFADAMQSGQAAQTMRASRPEHHVDPPSRGGTYRSFDLGGEASPNGNTVSLEAEMVRATRAKSDHELALTVYKSSLDIIRTALGRGR
jgi:flagellar basal-body rod protein FlgB